MALGFSGQRIYILPEQNLVVTVLAGNYHSDGGTISDEVMLRVFQALD
ncbi:MAG: hypothetical protein P8Q36_07190 [Alphaproteobacteria bacterium]|jgi:hypothetical protein|nr:hypothetical protein [Rhodospirillaceae bacterium]MDG2480638.1 hypothetical protein [Alphaproteobacteria bacterium]